MIRSPIISVLGHVDHGKSSILDAVRGSSIVNTEAGKITQAIGASIVPIETLKKICGSLMEKIGEVKVPGLLFIDTPGHAAFTSLRKRGGSLADIAILVVDINEGFKPQTIEAIEILKSYKTPFVVAANKLDLVAGFKSRNKFVIPDINSQPDSVKQKLEEKIYELVGKFYDAGLKAERFDRVSDFSKELAIVPCSAITNEGIPELLMIMLALTQKYLEKKLNFNVEGEGRGTILEVKEEKGLGHTIDVIVYDGNIKVNDTLVIGCVGEPIVTKVRALLEPSPLMEMRDKKARFVKIDKAVSSTGVKISAPELDRAIAGMPVFVVRDEEKVSEFRKKLKEEVGSVSLDVDREGIILKADNLGSLEAMIHILREKNVSIRKATIGNVSKKDVLDAETNLEKDERLGIILGFNVKLEKDVKLPKKVSFISGNIIYKILEDYEEWLDKKEEEIKKRELEGKVRPFKIRVLKGCIFRQKNPCVFGVEVLGGTLRKNIRLMKKDNSVIEGIKSMQKNKSEIKEAKEGEQIAVSVEGAVGEKNIIEDDIFYSDMPEENFRVWKKHPKELSEKEKEIIREIAEIKRKENEEWGT